MLDGHRKNGLCGGKLLKRSFQAASGDTDRVKTLEDLNCGCSREGSRKSRKEFPNMQ